MPTDLQLQLALAKMLPEKIYIDESSGNHYQFRWAHSNGDIEEDWFELRHTEWFHVCWLVEQTLDNREGDMFASFLAEPDYGGRVDRGRLCVDATTKIVSASWQQRAQALCKVKGVEI